jgi:hypothetical protein
MHHLREREKLLGYMISKVKAGGWFGFTEMVKSTGKAKNYPFIEGLKKIIFKEKARHSEGEYIDSINLVNMLKNYSSTYALHYEYSAIRTLLGWFFVDILKINNKVLTYIMLKIDGLFIRLLGKRLAIFGPKEILFVARKK